MSILMIFDALEFFLQPSIISLQINLLVDHMQQQHNTKRTSLCNRFLTGSMRGNSNNIVVNPPGGFYSPKQNQPFWLSARNKNTSSKACSTQNISSKFFPSQKGKMQNEDNHQINNLISTGPTFLNKLANISLSNALLLLDRILNQCAYTHQLFGHSNFQIENTFITSSGQVILTKPSPLNSFIKITDETVVVKKIIQSIYDLCAPKVFDDFYSFYSRTQGKIRCDFKYVSSLIKSYCMCSKIVMKDKFDFSQKSTGVYLKPQILRLSTRAISSLQQSRSSRSRRRRMTLEGTDLSNDMRRIRTSKSQEKSQNKKCRSSKKSGIAKSGKFFKKDMTKSNQISHQFSMKISSHSSNNNIKDSLASTNFKTSGLQNSSNIQNGTTDMSITFNGNFGCNHSSNLLTTPPSNQQIKPFLSANNLFEVQSQCEQSSECNPSMDSSRKKFDTPSIEEKISQQKVEQLFLNNNWTRRVNTLLTDTQMHQSFSEGKEEVCPNSNLNPQHLGKLARAVVESMLSSPLLQQKRKSSYQNNF